MKQKPKNETRFKVAIALCLGVFAVATAVSMLLAAARVTRVVDGDYYTHGLHYRSQPKWVMTAALQRKALQVQVRDEKGAPVSGGQLEYRIEPAPGSAAAPLALREAAPGVYRATCSASGGDLHGTLCFSKGDATLSSKMVLFR